MKHIAALLLIFFAVQSHAGMFTDDEARERISDLRNTVQTLQTQTKKLEDRAAQQENAGKRTLDLIKQIDQLREEIATLRGKIEVLQFNQDEAIKRQTTLYVDLDARLRGIESRPELETRIRSLEAKELAREQQAKEQAREQQQQDEKAAQLAAEQKLVDDAIGMVKTGKNKEGVIALSKFVAENPQSTRYAEATYWIGVGHLALKNYKSASASFNDVINKAPTSPRAPDSLLSLASISVAMKDAKTSRKYLNTIVEKYPHSEAAVMAKKALAVPN